MKTGKLIVVGDKVLPKYRRPPNFPSFQHLKTCPPSEVSRVYRQFLETSPIKQMDDLFYWSRVHQIVSDRNLRYSPSEIPIILLGLGRSMQAVHQHKALLRQEVTGQDSLSSNVSDATIRGLTQRFRVQLPSATFDDCAAFMWTLQKMSWRSVRSLEQIGQKMVREANLAPGIRPNVEGPHLTSLLLSFTRLGVASVSGLSAMCAHWVPQLASRMRPYELAMCANALLNLRKKEDSQFHGHLKRVLEAVGRVAAPNLEGFGSTQLALLANAFARAGFPHYVFFLELESEVVRRSNQAERDVWNSRDIAQVCNAFGKLQLSAKPAFEAMAPHIMGHIREFSPQSLSNTAYGFAKAGVPHERVMAQLALMATRILHQMRTRDLAFLALSYAKLRIPADDLFLRISDEFLFRSTLFTCTQVSRAQIERHYARFKASQYGLLCRTLESDFGVDLLDVSLITNAFTQLGYHDDRLFFGLSDLVRALIKDRKKKDQLLPQSDGQLKVQNNVPVWLANLMCSFSRAQKYVQMNQNFSDWILRQFQVLLSQKVVLAPHQYTLLVDGAARFRLKNRQLRGQLLKMGGDRLDQLTPSEFGRVIFSMGRLQAYKPYFYRSAQKVCLIRMTEFSGTDLLKVAQGLAVVRVRDEDFLKKLFKSLHFKRHELSVAEGVQAIQAFADIRLDLELFLGTFLEMFLDKYQEMSERSLILMLQSVCQLVAVDLKTRGSLLDHHGRQLTDAVNLLLKRLYKMYRTQKIQLTHLVALQKCDVFMRLCLDSWRHLLAYESTELLNLLRSVDVGSDDLRLHANDYEGPSYVVREISYYLTQVGLFNRLDVKFGPVFLDVLVGDHLVIEVDHPKDYFRDTLMRTPAAFIKHMVLQKSGLRLEHVSIYEWDQLTSRREKLQFCARLWDRSAHQPVLLLGT